MFTLTLSVFGTVFALLLFAIALRWGRIEAAFCLSVVIAVGVTLLVVSALTGVSI